MDEKIDQIKIWLGQGSINLFGRPFSGKDTQGDIISEYFNAPLISGGEILRFHKDNTELQRIMASGENIPSDMYLNLILPYLSKTEYVDKPLMLSTVGRSAGEEKSILEATSRSDHELKAVILINVSEEVVWARFEKSQKDHDRGGRADDSKQALERRLKRFNDDTMLVINTYEEMGLIIEINGNQSKEEVTAELINKLFDYSQR